MRATKGEQIKRPSASLSGFALSAIRCSFFCYCIRVGRILWRWHNSHLFQLSHKDISLILQTLCRPFKILEVCFVVCNSLEKLLAFRLNVCFLYSGNGIILPETSVQSFLFSIRRSLILSLSKTCKHCKLYTMCTSLADFSASFNPCPASHMKQKGGKGCFEKKVVF